MKKAHWEKAKDIFEQAMAIASDARGQFLDKACADDKVVRQEVEELLSSLENAESFMENPAVNQVAKEIIVENEKLESGRKLLHYEIIKPIGAGGMGEVYLAQDTKLKRKVALKFLPPELTADKKYLQRFEQEARVASALNHPNILTIHEIGVSDGVHFIATEFIDGETLRQKMKSEEGLTLKEVLEIATQTASALVAAHEAGIIHRDIKPENIMMRRDRIVKVVDFGLAKLTETAINNDSVDIEAATKIKTGVGVVMGTVNYMSPEQARAKELDARTDVWSLGCVLYEMVAGKKPFAGETTTDTLAAILTNEPKPLTDFNAETPDELQHIVTKTLQKKSDERYQSAKDLLADLRELKQEFDYRTKDKANLKLSKDTNDKTLVADALTTNEAQTEMLTAQQSQPQTTSSAEYIVSEIKQHKRGFAIALSALLIATLGFGYWFFFNRSAASIESIAVMPFVNDSGNADVEYLSDGMTETLIRSLSKVPNLTVKARSSVFRYKGKEVAPQQIAQELNVQAILTGRVVQRGDQLTLWLELVDARTENVIWSEQYNRQSSDLVALQSEIARNVSNNLKKLSGAEEQKIAKNYTENAEAYQLYLRGRYYWNKRTAEGMLKGIEYFNQAIKVDPNYALAYSGLADCYILRAAPFPPKERLQNAKTAVTQALEIDETLAEAHTSLGRIKTDYEWDWAGAEREYKRALELNPNYATTHQWYALYLSSVGRNDEAIREAKRAQELEPLSLSINTTLGWVLFYAGKTDEALEQIRKTLEMDPNFADALFAGAHVYEAKKLYAEAIAASQKAINLDDDPKLIAELGYIYAASGKSAEAKQILIRLEQLPQGKYIPSYNVARIYSALGEKEKAIKWLEIAFEEHQPEIRSQLQRGEWQNNLRSDPRFQDLLRRIGLAP